MPTSEELQKLNEELFEIVSEQLQSKDWTTCHTHQGIQVEKKIYENHKSKSPVYRATCYIPTTCQEVVASFENIERRVSWGTELEEMKMITPEGDLKLPSNATIVYSKTKSQFGGMISPRDFIDLSCIKVNQEDGSHWIYYQSIELDQMPHHPHVVRGFNHAAGTLAVPHGKGSMVTVSLHVDIGGSIPSWVMNSATPNAVANLLHGLKSHIIKIGKNTE